LKYKALPWIILISILMILPVFVSGVSAQAQSNYYVTVKPTTANSPMYTTVGQNWTVSFEAVWSYGSDSGKSIQNATAAIQVSNREKQIIDNLSLNTTTGIFYFNYSSPTADILTFTPTKLTTQDGKTWKTSIVDSANNVYGLQSQSAVIWWDTFHMSQVSSNTNSLGKVAISVNVTYLLLPEEGLTLPAWATYSNQTFLPKIAQNATVTINDVKAEESQVPGIYSASSSTWLPTTYVNVEVSQEGWTTTSTGISFAHNANQPVWTYAVGLGSAFTFATVMLYFFKSRKANNPLLFKHPSFPFFGGVLLAVTSVISLYWGLVGLEGTLHTFNWILLAILGMLSFAFGIVGAVSSLRRKNQALAIFAVIVPMFMNVIAVKSSLDMYKLTNPWVILLVSVLLSIISGYLISNSDENFKKPNSDQKIQLKKEANVSSP
jgi:hypothetical protein